jgi:hypothetical protein
MPSVPIMCPSSFASVPRGSACSPQGGYCDYPEGRCACSFQLGPNPQATWSCQDPNTSACPLPRPRVGSPCSQDQLFCDYGSCGVPDGTGEQCTGGVWISINVACGAGAPP